MHPAVVPPASTQPGRRRPSPRRQAVGELVNECDSIGLGGLGNGIFRPGNDDTGVNDDDR